jgi:hypothetical protein
MYDLMQPGVRTKEPTQPAITERISLMQSLERLITVAFDGYHFGEICEKKINPPHT